MLYENIKKKLVKIVSLFKKKEKLDTRSKKYLYK